MAYDTRTVDRRLHLRTVPPPAAQAACTTVATYDDYRRALAAVQHLSDCGDAAGVHLALTRFERVSVRRDSSVAEQSRRAAVPAATAALATALGFSIVPSVTLDGPVLAVLATLVMAATAAVTFTGLVRGSRSGLPVRRIALVPTRYEVRCNDVDDETAGDFEHCLASWWQIGLDDPPQAPDGSRLRG